MIKKIFDIIKKPFVVPVRINRVSFINQWGINIILLAIVWYLPGKMMDFYDPIPIDVSKDLANSAIYVLKSNFVFILFYMLLIPLYCILFMITFCRLCIARLHDMNFRGLWVLLLIVPLVNFLLSFIICLLPGTKDENRFGKQPALESKAKTILSFVSIVLILCALVFIAQQTSMIFAYSLYYLLH